MASPSLLGPAMSISDLQAVPKFITLSDLLDFLANLSFRGLPLHEPDHLMAWTEIGEFG